MTIETLTLTTEPGWFGDYGSIYAGGSEVSCLGGQAAARMTAHRFKRMLLFDRHSKGLAHQRSPSGVKRDGNDHLSIHLLVEGSFIGGPPGARRELRPGQIFIFDTSQPMWSQSTEAHYITAWIARDQVARKAIDLRAFGGIALPVSACDLLGDFMTMVSRRARTMSPEVGESASHVMGELIAATLSGTVAPSTQTLPDDVGTLLRQERIESFITSRLADPNLDVQKIAAGIGLSRASIYRAFEGVGGVARFIQKRRVSALRDALRRPGERRSVSALSHAVGFSSESHCSRQFKRAFGVSPSQFRTEMNEVRSSPTNASLWSDIFIRWRSELY